MSASTEKTLQKAKRAAKQGDWIGAVHDYRSVLVRFPANKRASQGFEALRPNLQAILKAAETAEKEGDLAQAERAMHAAFCLSHEDAEIGLAHARVCFEMGRSAKAMETADAILKTAPENVDALNAKGRALMDLGQGDAAEACHLKALEIGGGTAETLTFLGRAAQSLGQIGQATDHFRSAVALAPADPALHNNLAQVLRYTPDEPHLAQMRALAKEEPGQARLYFALFQALDQLGELDEAFACLEIGNRLAKAEASYDFTPYVATFALAKSLFSNPVQISPKPARFRPIFVTGLPRTGTTLVERILSQSPGVQACGELTVVKHASSALCREVVGRPNRALQEADLLALRAELLNGFSAYSDASPVLIDKNPFNYRWIGFIAAALPEARIVHMNRDPMAVAWSLYRHHFATLGNAFTHDIGDIIRYMALHRTQMAFWREALPGRVFDMSYEALATNPDQSTKALAEAVGLDWSEAWLRPEDAKNRVLTASALQVQKPIYRSSGEGWRPYENQLALMRSALEAAGFLRNDQTA